MKKTLIGCLIIAAAFVTSAQVFTLTQITNVNLGTGPLAGDGDLAYTAFTKENVNTLALSNVVSQLQQNSLTNGGTNMSLAGTFSGNINFGFIFSNRLQLGPFTNVIIGYLPLWTNNGIVYGLPVGTNQ